MCVFCNHLLYVKRNLVRFYEIGHFVIDQLCIQGYTDLFICLVNAFAWFQNFQMNYNGLFIFGVGPWAVVTFHYSLQFS